MITHEDPRPVFTEARGSAIRDEFRGDTEHLRECILALIELNDSGALVPHGIGGHARALLAACYHRLPNNPTERTALEKLRKEND